MVILSLCSLLFRNSLTFWYRLFEGTTTSNTKMVPRFLNNPYPDYVRDQPINVDEEHIKNLIIIYVDEILHNTSDFSRSDSGDGLYVGNGGIAYMFWKLGRSSKTKDLYHSLQHAQSYVNHAKSMCYRNRRHSDKVAFLTGNAGIYAVSSVIHLDLNDTDTAVDDIEQFKKGAELCDSLNFGVNGGDEVLVGRAGYLSGCYFLNDIISPPPINHESILRICKVMIDSGRLYSKNNGSPLPLMYNYHGTEYLGAAHGLCAILHMLLDSPWFKPNGPEISKTKALEIKQSIDFFVSLQDEDGNFPVALADAKLPQAKRLVHWCHGAPGAIYLLVKAFLIYKDQRYFSAAVRAADLIWVKGFLRKGPGICHGIAGNGYAFLLMYRLTRDKKYLYRAEKFMRLLTNPEFKVHARTPDRPFSLYEGVAGTVCYLIDLMEPEKSYFPFMEVYH